MRKCFKCGTDISDKPANWCRCARCERNTDVIVALKARADKLAEEAARAALTLAAAYDMEAIVLRLAGGQTGVIVPSGSIEFRCAGQAQRWLDDRGSDIEYQERRKCAACSGTGRKQ